MKVIIDLIEDIRESIGNADDFVLHAGLLKEDRSDSSKLIYSGEAAIGTFSLDTDRKELLFTIGDNDTNIAIGELIPQLLILGMDAMMYELKIEVNAQYRDIEVIGFGKSNEEKSYILFIKL